MEFKEFDILVVILLFIVELVFIILSEFVTEFEFIVILLELELLEVGLELELELELEFVIFCLNKLLTDCDLYFGLFNEFKELPDLGKFELYDIWN